jgi:hypothetical protein
MLKQNRYHSRRSASPNYAITFYCCIYPIPHQSSSSTTRLISSSSGKAISLGPASGKACAYWGLENLGFSLWGTLYRASDDW